MPDPADPDRDVVERLQGGDDAALEELIRRYQKPILSFIFRMTRDPDAADDLAQEVFVRVYRKVGRFRFRRGVRFSTWLFQLARNASLDHLRRVSRRTEVRLEENHRHGELEPAPAGTAAKDAQTRELGEAIAAAVAELPEDQRTCVVLSEYEGLPTADIAEIMRCSVKSVESRLYRARQSLRTRLADFLR